MKKKNIPENTILPNIIGIATRYKSDGTIYKEEYHQRRIFNTDIKGMYQH